MIKLMILGFVLIVLNIGLLDYLLFYKWSKCPYCNKHTATWSSYIPATFLELSMFIGGIYVGVTFF